MNKLRATWNRIYIWSFDLFFYDWLSLLGGTLLIIGLVFLVCPVKDISFAAKITLSLAVYLTAYLLLSVSSRKRLQRKELKQSGSKVEGRVVGIHRSIAKVYMSTMHYADEDAVHPFAIRYSYRFNGEKYAGKTEYFWARPCLKEGDAVTVFVDKQKPKHSALDTANIELIW